MKLPLKMTAEDIAKYRAEHPELAELERKFRKRITGNTRNAVLCEMLIPRFGAEVKVTKATIPTASGGSKTTNE